MQRDYLTVSVPLYQLELLVKNVRDHQSPDENGLVRLSVDVDDRFVRLTTKHLSRDGLYAEALGLVTEDE